MNESEAISFSRNPLFRVITAWLWLIVGLLLMQAHPSFARRMFGGAFSSYFEIVMAGLIPLVFTVYDREGWSRYGLTKKGFTKSLLGAAIIVAFVHGFFYLSTGHWMEHRNLTSTFTLPARIWYAVLGVFAYGPLEMFFFVWLVKNTGEIFRVERQNSFWVGLAVTTIIWGLVHIVATHRLSTGLVVSVVFFLFGVIWRYTNNSIGPMIGWTLINGQVWFLVSILRS
jgi:membrane protease YdiL (CAAX protease family)